MRRRRVHPEALEAEGAELVQRTLTVEEYSGLQLVISAAELTVIYVDLLAYLPIYGSISTFCERTNNYCV